eukprot:3802858-Alexandrium_andersonii.AAC.1
MRLQHAPLFGWGSRVAVAPSVRAGGSRGATAPRADPPQNIRGNGPLGVAPHKRPALWELSPR